VRRARPHFRQSRQGAEERGGGGSFFCDQLPVKAAEIKVRLGSLLRKPLT